MSCAPGNRLCEEQLTTCDPVAREPSQTAAFLFDVSTNVIVPVGPGFRFAGVIVAVNATDWLTVEVLEGEDAIPTVVLAEATVRLYVSVADW